MKTIYFRYIITVVFCHIALAISTYSIQAAEADRPNILLILIDDMGWKDIACAGSTYYETPHIDELAANGMRFVNAYSSSPVCTPSRGAIFSGKNPARTKLTTVFSASTGAGDRLFDKSKYQGENHQYLEARHRHALPKDEVILAEALADGGYTTGFFGKWHCGETPGHFPDERGFHVAKGYRHTQVGSAKSGHWMKTFHRYGANLDGVSRDAYVADVLTDECINFIKKNQEKPWLAVLSHYLVHSPIDPRPEKVPNYKKKAGTDQNNPKYAAMVESVDDSVGKLVQAIKELGLEDNTLVIFTSDNGGHTPGTTSNYPLMGGKSFPFEAGMKVPFIAKWPGIIEPSVCEERIVGMDVYPTMLAAAGLPLRPKQHAEGLDLVPLFTNKSPLKKRPIIFHFPHYSHATGPFSAIIEDNWKLIRFYNDKHGAHLLYNLAVDPEEQNNLAETNTDIRDRLEHQLTSSLLEMKAEMPILNPNYTSGQKDKGKHLKSTLNLANKERLEFESRLKEQRQQAVSDND
jgi:arylsulfatase A-like enzyme